MLRDNIKRKKTTIKRMSNIFNIKTKQNKMKIDERWKKNLKKIKTRKN